MRTIDQLISAIESNRESGTITINNDFEVNDTQQDGYCAMHYAAKYDDVKMVKRLQELGANVTAKATDGATPLFIACEQGSLDVVKHLADEDRVKNSSEVDELSETHTTPLIVAALNGHTEIVLHLSKMKNVFSDKSTPTGITPLLAAVSSSNNETVKTVCQLMKSSDLDKADYNKRDSFGTTAFMLACLTNQTAIISYLLLLEQVDVNIGLPDGTSPLLALCQNENLESVKNLIDVHSTILDVNTARHSDGVNPLVTAAQCDSVEIASLLLRCPSIDVNFRLPDSGTPLLISCERDYTRMALLLLSHPDIDVNCAFDFGPTPLILSAHNGNLQITKYLTGLAATNLNACGPDGCSVLLIACQMNQVAVVAHLLSLSGVSSTVNKKLLTTGDTAFSVVCNDGDDIEIEMRTPEAQKLR
eukprot:TRINITY_DN5182_c0_g1_i1.p1 TRINITY_DN5182_c0_g1~~TRINITY_DN5182_c0_g1_i1.p1  ORF type:complete len:418 (+),score=75.61 TRINITY_DN5182_c0_g1_i1:181-1434(+)